MSFLIPCPNCGDREVYEFRHGGELSPLSERRSMDDSDDALTRYFYFTKNVAGENAEWWYHSYGCRKWFIAYRDTRTNRVRQAEWPRKKPHR